MRRIRPSASTSRKAVRSQRQKFCRPYLERLEDRLAPANTPFQNLADSIGSHLTDLQGTIDTALNNASHLPLLSQGGNGVLGTIAEAQGVTDSFVSNVENALNNTDDKTKDSDVQNSIAAALGIDPARVKVSHPGDPNNVEIEVELHRDLGNATLPANFNLSLGLPGLPVNITASTKGSIQAQLGYDFAVDFGYNGSFFLGTGAKASDFGSLLPAHQFSLHAVVNPSDDFAATATVGLLQATVDNRSHASKLDGTFNVDNAGVAGQQVSLTGSANLNLHAAASFAAAGNFTFPGMGTDIIVNWDISGKTPDVEFKNTSFELGSFLSNFVAPIVQDIQTVTSPLAPIIDVLTAQGKVVAGAALRLDS